MLAGKCDRCGKFYGLNGRITITVKRFNKDMTNGRTSLGHDFELCPDCVAEFDSWVKMEEEGEQSA